jgi:hypothetical protein
MRSSERGVRNCRKAADEELKVMSENEEDEEEDEDEEAGQIQR